ncbi:MAG TPA: TIGR01777 family oxidoreductase [Acidobacteriaceae bacterium]
MERILLTGGSGVIGTAVRRSFSENGLQTLQLVREARGREAALPWDPYAVDPVPDLSPLEGISAAIHLSGANVAGHRWTKARKQMIRDSRVRTTRAVAKLLARLKRRPRVLICASAIGIYGSRGDELIDEQSAVGHDFLASVCKEWEEAAQPAADAGIRVVHSRFGVVLSPNGGALTKLLPLFRLGLGGQMGSGRQWVSWVALPDVVRAIDFALHTETISGPVNITAPEPVTNAEFTRKLADVLRRPALLFVPELVLQLAFGEMAQSTILASQRVVSKRLNEEGFKFECPELSVALSFLLRN